MTADDTPRSRRAATIHRLREWAGSVRDVADIAEEEAPGYWRMKADPATPGACPFELLMTEEGYYAIVIDGRAYEDLEITDYDIMRPLAEAIAAGRVERITTLVAATGLELSVATRVTMAYGKRWERTDKSAASELIGEIAEFDTVEEVTRYLPYRR